MLTILFEPLQVQIRSDQRYSLLKPNDRMALDCAIYLMIIPLQICKISVTILRLIQCWLIINMVLWYSPEDNSTGHVRDISQYILFENQTFNNIATSSKEQWVNTHYLVMFSRKSILYLCGTRSILCVGYLFFSHRLRSHHHRDIPHQLWVDLYAGLTPSGTQRYRAIWECYLKWERRDILKELWGALFLYKCP